MQNRVTPALLRYLEQTYGPDMWRRLGMATTTVPAALSTLISRRFTRGIFALPLAVVTTALSTVLAGLLLINVGYPLRQVLGLGGHEGSVWAGNYDDAWGGPTLLGAWAVHATLAMLLIFPALGWAIRGLVQLQLRLTRTTAGSARGTAAGSARGTAAGSARGTAAGSARGTTAGSDRTTTAGSDRETSVAIASRETEQPVTRRPSVRHQRRASGRSIAIAGAAFVTAYALALVANTAGIGDNVVWLPRDLLSSLALTVVLSPIIAAALTIYVRSGSKGDRRRRRGAA